MGLNEEICITREFEHERYMMKWIEFCVGLGLYSLWMCTCDLDEKDVERLIDSRCWRSRKESGKERVWEKRKRERREKVV